MAVLEYLKCGFPVVVFDQKRNILLHGGKVHHLYAFVRTEEQRTVGSKEQTSQVAQVRNLDTVAADGLLDTFAVAKV
jgi:hypothetical protein